MFPRFRLVCLSLLLGTSPLLLTGCWDRVEVNDLAVVVASSVDKEEDGQYRVGVQIPLVAQLGGGPSGGGGGSAFYIDSEKGRTIREAINHMQRRMSRQMIFSHRRIFVVSEEVAKEDGVRNFFDEIARLPDNRLTTYMIISKGKAMNLLEATPQFESFSAENMREIVKLPFVITVSLRDVATIMNRRGADPIVPYLAVVESNAEKKEKEIQFLGYAQFRWDKMVGVFEENAAYGANWFQSNFIPYTSTFEVDEEGEEGPITVKIFEADKTIKPRIKQGKIYYDMKVTARGAIQESMQTADLRYLKNQEKLNRQFAQHIKQHIEAFISESKSKKTDSAQLGRILARYYPNEWNQKYAKNWEEELADITVHVEVDAKVDRLGQITENITRERMEP